MSKNTINPYEGLANGIILQAVKDYHSAIHKLSKGRKKQAAEQMKGECIRFFRSPWFKALTDVDAEFLIQKLKEEVEA